MFSEHLVNDRLDAGPGGRRLGAEEGEPAQPVEPELKPAGNVTAGRHMLTANNINDSDDSDKGKCLNFLSTSCVPGFISGISRAEPT